MIYRCFVELGVLPRRRVSKSTIRRQASPEVSSGGCWTVGVALSGNAVRLSERELADLSPEQRIEYTRRAMAGLADAGAHRGHRLGR